jgi:nitrogen fixation-related uncharacterized protein
MEDLEGPAYRILMDDDSPVDSAKQITEDGKPGAA